VNGGACGAFVGFGAATFALATSTVFDGFADGGVKTLGWSSSSASTGSGVAGASGAAGGLLTAGDSGALGVEGVLGFDPPPFGVVSVVGVVTVGVVSVGVVSVGVVSVGVVSVGVVSFLQWSSFWPPLLPCSSQSFPWSGCGSSLHGFVALPCSQFGWPGGDGGFSEEAANAAAPPSPKAAIIAATTRNFFIRLSFWTCSNFARARVVARSAFAVGLLDFLLP
jgi:hypothetical protein